jgi:AcrR family transcriptional regulator
MRVPKPKKKTGEDKVRERILQAATELFYKEGVHAVGIDRILRQANAAKASLYAHFSSKDELVATYLDRRGNQWRDHVVKEMEKRGGSAADRLLLLFDLMASWTCSREFRGCPFTNAAGELSDPDHPAHAMTQRHRQWLQKLIRNLVEETGTSEVDKMVQSIVVLYDGAVAVALVDGNREAATAARWVLENLLQKKS